MELIRVTDETELIDDRIYLCCRSSRHGNAIWQTLEARKHRLLSGDITMPFKAFTKIYHLPKRIADIDDKPATQS